MTQLYFKKSATEIKQVALIEGESVLNGLLRSGVDIPYGCRTGVCQSCILRSVDSEVPHSAQRGLREVQKRQGYFLSCCCQPKTPMIVSLSEQSKKTCATVLEKSLLAPDIVRLRLEKVASYHPGQYMTLWKDADTARTYSLASHPTQDDFLEFHIRVYAGGAFSQWAAQDLSVDDSIGVQGPMGNCYYAEEDRNQALFMAGMGTGLAPLYGIVRDALSRGHTGRILMLLGSTNESGAYYQREIEELERRYINFEVRRSIRELPPELHATKGREIDIYATAQRMISNFEGIKVYLCGGDSFVRTMRKQCFLAGANFGDIHSDTFLSFPQ